MELATKSATSTKEDDDDLDDTELSRIKEFLEEAVSTKGVSRMNSRTTFRVSAFFINFFALLAPYSRA
jgi:hypothetical protein